MSYVDKMGIKSVVGLNKWFKAEVAKRSQKTVDLECVKVDSYVYIYWAVDNKLHKYAMKASVIYVLQEEDLEGAIKSVIESL